MHRTVDVWVVSSTPTTKYVSDPSGHVALWAHLGVIWLLRVHFQRSMCKTEGTARCVWVIRRTGRCVSCKPSGLGRGSVRRILPEWSVSSVRKSHTAPNYFQGNTFTVCALLPYQLTAVIAAVSFLPSTCGLWPLLLIDGPLCSSKVRNSLLIPAQRKSATNI